MLRSSKAKLPMMSEAEVQDTKALVQSLSIVSAKNYVPGKEHEILQAIRVLLLSSMELLNHNIATAATEAKVQASEWFSWSSTLGKTSRKVSGEEKRCDEETDIRSDRSGDFTTGEMDTIMDSMTFVLEVMEQYHQKAREAVSGFISDLELDLPEARLPAEFETMDENADSNWTVKDAGLDKSSPADFLLGSFLPKSGGDNYPQGTKPIDNLMPSCGPTTDMLLGSLNSLLNGISEDKYEIKLSSRLSHLNDIQTVSTACSSQAKELDTIIKKQKQLSKKEDTEVIKECSTTATKEAADMDASVYLQAARDKLSEYASLAENALKDEVKCVVSDYTCAGRCTSMGAENDDQEGRYFEALQEHFSGEAYNIDSNDFLAVQESGHDEMQQMLLNMLHSSLFLRNVGDKCRDEIREHVGKELSEYICRILTRSILLPSVDDQDEKRISEWGAILFAKHARALHSYIYEFCHCSPGETKNILSNIAKTGFSPLPMDDKWEKLFMAVDILSLENLSLFQRDMMGECLSKREVKQILSLRTDLTEEAIDTALRINVPY